MTTIARVILNWTGTAVVGAASANFHFIEFGSTPQQCVDTVGAMMAELDAQLSGELNWATSAGVESIDVVTGEIQSVTITTPISGTGSGSGQRLPTAAQGLIQWRTGAYVGGREIRGRTFLPGCLEINNDAGVPIGSFLSAMNLAAGALVLNDPDVHPVIWTKTHGTAAQIQFGEPWSQWAVLRSRRD